MEGVNMLVNKRRQRGQQNQGNSDQYGQNSGGFQGDRYDEQNEEVQYVNNYQGQRGNSSNQQQWRPQGSWGNQQQQGNSNWGNNNQSANWGNQKNNQGNWNGNNNNWGRNNNQGGWNNSNQGNRGQGFPRPPMYQQSNNPPLFPYQGPSSSKNEIGKIEMMFEEMIKNNADSNAQLASHNTSIKNLEVQLGQISQSLNTRPKGALPSDTVVNPKGGNNSRHVMANVIDENVNEEVRIDIQDAEVETQNDMNLSREHVIDMPKRIVPKAKAPLPRTPPPYPQRLAKQKNENRFKKFIDMMKRLSINVSLV
ncbi:uncharacterized protein [Nicotiana sylvestris]|uniref:uncharacterized protein n=1 Tax=Nicotiana sylvestris TaxID=4096 RepID=UPI00388C862D